MIIDLDNILEMWRTDSVIDQFQLDETTMNIAKLHGKYLELFSITKLQIKKAEYSLDDMLKNKWEWYNGRMDKDTIDSLGWQYDPFEGCAKPLKGDMERYYRADKDIQKIKAKIDYLVTVKETLDEIIGTLRWRHSAIKNIIDFRKFESGM